MDEHTRSRLAPVVPDVVARWEAFRDARGDDLPAFLGELRAQGFVDGALAEELVAGVVHSEDRSTVAVDAPRTLRTWDPGAGPPDDGLADLPGRGMGIVGKAGEGAMGEVLVATDQDLGRTVAFKVIGKTLASDPGKAARFYGEARITAQLDHPGVVPIHGLARSPDGRLGYTMKLVEGRTLGHWLAEEPVLEARLDAFLKICDAVGYAHHRGVVHRDLKPDNVMVGHHGEVWVMDWGVARLTDDAEIRVPRAAEPATGLIGTVGFMSPEQAGGTLALDGRSDQYALGVILQELVTLCDPTVPGTSLHRLAANQVGRRQPMRHRRGEPVARELVAIVDRATALRPEDRYPDVEALADDVRRFLRGEAVRARPDTPWAALLRWTGRHRAGVLAALALTLLGGAAAIGWVEAARLRDRAQAVEAERALSALLGRRAVQAASIDARLVRSEGLARTLAATAAERFVRGAPGDGPVFLAADFVARERAPPDLRHDAFYGMPVSLAHPVLLVPEPPSEGDVAAARRLAPMVDLLREEMARAAGLAPAFLSVAFESGVSLSYPGHGAFPPGYDARARPWYTVARDAAAAVWGAPYIDSGGLGLLLPCSAPIRDGGRFLGVASIKLPLARVIGDLLETEDGEAFVLDAQGRVIIRTTQRTDAAAALVNTPVEPEPFPVAEVVEAIRAGAPGPHVVGRGPDREVVSWHPLPDLGWTYVVRGR